MTGAGVGVIPARFRLLGFGVIVIMGNDERGQGDFDGGCHDSSSAPGGSSPPGVVVLERDFVGVEGQHVLRCPRAQVKGVAIGGGRQA